MKGGGYDVFSFFLGENLLFLVKMKIFDTLEGCVANRFESCILKSQFLSLISYFFLWVRMWSRNLSKYRIQKKNISCPGTRNNVLMDGNGETPMDVW